jgi:hypothetical protein
MSLTRRIGLRERRAFLIALWKAVAKMFFWDWKDITSLVAQLICEQI